MNVERDAQPNVKRVNLNDNVLVLLEVVLYKLFLLLRIGIYRYHLAYMDSSSFPCLSYQHLYLLYPESLKASEHVVLAT